MIIPGLMRVFATLGLCPADPKITLRPHKYAVRAYFFKSFSNDNGDAQDDA